MKTRRPRDAMAARRTARRDPGAGTAGWTQAQADRAQARTVLRARPRSTSPIRAPAATPTVTLLVDDSPGPAQMDKAAWLAQLRTAIIAGASEELASGGWTADGCPWIEYWLSYYEGRSAQECEAALHRFAPATRRATSAHDYTELTVARVRAAIRRWNTTGTIEPPFDAVAPAALAALGPDGLRATLGPGQPLDGDIKSRMERGFGRDLSDIRVHTGPAASAAAQDNAARALTIGTSIGFGAAQYRPGTMIGDLLIAHEIAHAVQQSGATSDTPARGAGGDEAHADMAAGTAVVRAAGIGVARPKLPARRGLALQRCSVVPREFDDEHQFEDQQEGEIKQTAWLRRFRRDYPKLEDIVLDPGPRDEGVETEAGIRIPKDPSHMLAKRPFYEHRFAAFFAYQGAIHYAELIENQQFKAANAIGQAARQRWGESLVHDKHLDMTAYYHWVFRAKQSADNLQTALMIVEGVRGIRDAVANRPPGPRSTAGEIEPPPAPPKAEPKVEPKVVVDPTLTEPVPPTTARPAPPTTAKPAPTAAKPAPAEPPAGSPRAAEPEGAAPFTETKPAAKPAEKARAPKAPPVESEGAMLAAAKGYKPAPRGYHWSTIEVNGQKIPIIKPAWKTKFEDGRLRIELEAQGEWTKYETAVQEKHAIEKYKKINPQLENIGNPISRKNFDKFHDLHAPCP